jgi:hypothetical protein
MTDETNCPNDSLPIFNQSNSGNHFNLRRFEPWYSNRADYNTNAKSYYDFLARFNAYIDDMTDMINRLLRRNIEFDNTNSIDFTKIGDWLDDLTGCCSFEDVIKISAVTNISDDTSTISIPGLPDSNIVVPNGTSIHNDGLWSPDYSSVLNEIGNELSDLETAIDKLNNTDVGNHLSISSDENTLTLSRKDLNGTAVSSDNVEIDIGTIKKELANQQTNSDPVQSCSLVFLYNAPNDSRFPQSNNPASLFATISQSNLKPGLHTISCNVYQLSTPNNSISVSFGIEINDFGGGSAIGQISYPTSWTSTAGVLAYENISIS